ncbi:hypothetical protein BpHYR1_014536 [Brachionus plicatilis]|uniref:Uncharacterized protein n=1 Tax=Brachionus plicatilis TaxID=10195 RepID=A0A3M7PY33_BRAPC|nr:hypothetical protein BpHYR1_014536 [Brachionus plicatilis]
MSLRQFDTQGSIFLLIRLLIHLLCFHLVILQLNILLPNDLLAKVTKLGQLAHQHSDMFTIKAFDILF